MTHYVPEYEKFKEEQEKLLAHIDYLENLLLEISFLVKYDDSMTAGKVFKKAYFHTKYGR